MTLGRDYVISISDGTFDKDRVFKRDQFIENSYNSLLFQVKRILGAAENGDVFDGRSIRMNKEVWVSSLIIICCWQKMFVLTEWQ